MIFQVLTDGHVSCHMRSGAFVFNEIIRCLICDIINPRNYFYNFILLVWLVYTFNFIFTIQIKPCFESLCNHFNEVVVFAACVYFKY